MISRQIRHCEKAFSADEAIFLTKIASRKDCFPEKSGQAFVPPRNDDLSKSVNGRDNYFIKDIFFLQNGRLREIVIPNSIGNRNAIALRFPPAQEWRRYYGILSIIAQRRIPQPMKKRELETHYSIILNQVRWYQVFPPELSYYSKRFD